MLRTRHRSYILRYPHGHFHRRSHYPSCIASNAPTPFPCVPKACCCKWRGSTDAARACIRSHRSDVPRKTSCMTDRGSPSSYSSIQGHQKEQTHTREEVASFPEVHHKCPIVRSGLWTTRTRSSRLFEQSSFCGSPCPPDLPGSGSPVCSIWM